MKQNQEVKTFRAANGKKASLWAMAITLVLFLSVLFMGVLNPEFAGSRTFALATVPYALALLFAVASYLESLFAEQAAREEEEKRELAKRKDTSLLEAESDVRFGAARAYANYIKFAPYVFSALGAIVTGSMLAGGYFWEKSFEGIPDNTMQAALASAILLFCSIFCGAFFLGKSREPGCRSLRPVGDNLLAGFGVLALSIIVYVGYYNRLLWDLTIAKIIFFVFALLGVEFILNLLIDFYRPRISAERRPVYESRILSLFTEPGGVMRNISESLDYQFGFKVSKTWMYGFVEKSILPLIVIFLAVFYFSTSIHQILPGEAGVRECFGRRVSDEILSEGVYFSLPYPFGGIRKENCLLIRTVVIGSSHDEEENNPINQLISDEIILWSKSHHGSENNFVVAAGSTLRKDEPHPVSFVGLNAPVQYQIENIIDFCYNSTDPEQTLQSIAEQAMIEYLAGKTLESVLGGERRIAEKFLFERIQSEVERSKLGIRLVAVNLLDMHPPVGEVSLAYQEVIGAMEKSETLIHEAEAYAYSLVPRAQAEAIAKKSDAESHRYRVVRVANAEKEWFERQQQSYLAEPAIYKLNTFLRILESNADKRKYIIGSGLNNEVYEINMEEKERLDLIDLVPAPIVTE